jgi:endonuclease III
MQATEPPYLMPPAEKTEEVRRTLAEHYGDLEWRPSIDPLSELVLTILSQHTSDLNRDRAFAEMRRRFPTWEEVRDARVEDLADSLRSGGLANQKAPRIQEVLRLIGEERGSLNLDFLMEMPPAEAKRWLSGFRGVGPKTAACVLMFACGMPVLPVDTHVYRVSQRLGLIGAKVSADQAHDVLEGMVAPEHRYPFHIHMITHGRRVCKAQRPRCEACVVRDHCLYYARLTGQTDAVL